MRDPSAVGDTRGDDAPATASVGAAPSPRISKRSRRGRRSHQQPLHGSVYPAILALCLTALLWGSGFPAQKAALAAYTPGEVVLLRLLGAGLCFALTLLPTGRAGLRDWRDLGRVVLLGLLGMFVYQTLLALGQNTISASAAGLVITAVPLMTAIIAVVIGNERLTGAGWLGLGLAAGGVTAITLSEGLDLGSIRGVGLIVVAAVCTGFYFVLQKPVLRRQPPVTFLAWAVWVSIPPALWAAPSLPEHMMAAPLQATLSALYLGVFTMAVGYGCYTFALSRLPASLATSFIYLQPPISVLIAWAWLGEQPGWVMFAGGALALVGVVMVTRYGMRPAPR